MTARSIQGWPRWLAALLMGLLLVLALLIASWFLRTCASVESSAEFVMREAEPLPAPPAPLDPTPVLKASLEEAAADGRKLSTELAALEADIKRRLALCKPVEPPKPPPPHPHPPSSRRRHHLRRRCRLTDGRRRTSPCCRVAGGWGGTRGAASPSTAGRRRATSTQGVSALAPTAVVSATSTANCPGTGTVTCTAPITARFGNDSTLGTTQPAVACNPTRTQWTGPPNSLSCRRVSDTLALCRDRLNFEYEFRRE